jgi:peptidyl-prolyl cis-trans isomerase B (cyclophilin B)
MKLTKRNLVITLTVLILTGSTILSTMDMFGGEVLSEEAPVIAVLETNRGVIEIELDEEAAPITVSNFIRYIEDGFFDGTIFHRVIPGFMIQGGGFMSDGTQKDTRDPIQLESDNGLKNLRGSIAMARTSDPNSATSQFFINLADNPFLNYRSSQPGYAVFGRVVSGMDIVNDIASVSTGMKGPYSDWPVEDIIIERVYMKT